MSAPYHWPTVDKMGSFSNWLIWGFITIPCYAINSDIMSIYSPPNIPCSSVYHVQILFKSFNLKVSSFWGKRVVYHFADILKFDSLLDTAITFSLWAHASSSHTWAEKEYQNPSHTYISCLPQITLCVNLWSINFLPLNWEILL